MAEKWKEVSGFAPMWSPESGEIVIGTVESSRPTDLGKQYSIRVDTPCDLTIYGKEANVVQAIKAGLIVTMPSHDVLNRQLDQVALGSRVRIAMTGKQKSKKPGHSDMILYSVAVAE